MANQRRSKQLINVLDVHETKDMLTIATDFYKDLFKAESRPDIRIREDFFSDEEKVSQVENDLLSAPFTVDEIKEAVYGSYSDGALGPDGLPFYFYQKYWDIIRHDLVELFNGWF